MGRSAVFSWICIGWDVEEVVVNYIDAIGVFLLTVN